MEKADSKKPLALLIPGLDGTGKLFYRQTPGLSKTHRVQPCAFRPRDSFDLPELAREIANGIEDEEPESVLVVGESFGGMIAMQFVLDHQDKVRRLALVNTFPVYRKRIRIRLGCLLSGLIDKPLPGRLKNFVVDRTLASEGIPAEDRLRYREAIDCVYHPAYCRRLQLVRDIDLRSRLHKITVPTFLFASGRDRIVPSVPEARYMHSVLTNSKIFEFPDAGHALLLTPGFDLSEYLGRGPFDE
jgi:pimeloyl-ACP methyl ester carboxylesterase